MNSYVTGAAIKGLREARGLTQAQLAGKLDVSDKTVSKWETGRGLPDITLMEPLSAALGVSVMELLSGDTVVNRNRSANLLRSKLYVCPICGNIIHTMGETVVSCCGVTLPALEAEEVDGAHRITMEPVEDEQFLVVHHPMTKAHFISFLAYVTSDRFQQVKLYPEGNAQCRFRFQGCGWLYLYCNRHGLMRQKV
ncbi:helix-turn-helix domain-containing protein [Pseudoflavonifractor phocaeensis]|uniref:helix-turn-helix domain-containing protein n=1 Tax=Pseudoflavonifractor phocaeensis TaxID=1870988 RepID=UPI0019574942|nr:helix-turn-helix domain-containing protein [Pseudoflavonifractor phocaeensis]MBM6926243.1 helix-turn-helix domain-containing protein [Pseudoflavonifractor phocaeensis]